MTNHPQRHGLISLISLLFFLGAGASFTLLSLLKSREKDFLQDAAGRQPGTGDVSRQGAGPYSLPGRSPERRAQRPDPQTLEALRKFFSLPRHRGPGVQGEEERIPPDGSFAHHPNQVNQSDISGISGDSPPETSLADIADYDTLDHSYTLKKADLSSASAKENIPADLLAALRVLNRRGMSADYFRTREYETAYQEIDLFYPDYYIWPCFTNTEARTNFFLFLFSRYAADNRNWRRYEKDKSDCSQFSQRVYLLLYPGEVHMEDEHYFRFLFSDGKTREERKKLCNKIPAVLYTTLTPYLPKRERSAPPPSGHAMISFSPDSNFQEVILAEPQTGDFESLDANPANILDDSLKRYPLICQMGKVVSIAEDRSHEARITLSGVYLLPGISPPGDLKYGQEYPRWDYGPKPILMQGQTYLLFQAISSYLSRVLNDQSVDRIGFLLSLEGMARNGKLSLLHSHSDLESSIDIVMHGLITLEPEDLRQVRDEFKELSELADRQPSLSPEVADFAARLNYGFLLKLEQFIG
ncbi:MAG: hypothetical protein AB1611_15065 [bacterium]